MNTGMYDFLVVLGVLTYLASAIIIIVTLVNWIRGRSRDFVLLGVGLNLFLSVTLFAVSDRSIRSLPDELSGYVDEFKMAIATLLWLSIAFTFNAVVNRFVWRGILSDDGKPAVPYPAIVAADVFVYLLAITVTMRFVYEADVTVLGVIWGVVAIIFGYSGRSTLGELFAGISVNAAKPYAKDDNVVIDDIWGTVHNVNWRSVIIRDLNGDLLTIPNSRIASNIIINRDLPLKELRRTFTVEFDYDAPPDTVRRLLVAAMLKCRYVVKSPEPEAVFLGFGELGMRYEARFWIKSFEDWWRAGDEVSAAVWHKFTGEGVRFAIRRRDIVTPYDPISADDCYRLFRALEYFISVPDEDVKALVAGAERHTFDPAEPIIHQDGAGDSMYLIIEGTVEVTIRLPDGTQHTPATLRPGQEFGIMSLLTGEPRSAAVTALEDVVLYEFTKPALQQVFYRHPETVIPIVDRVTNMQIENWRAAFDHKPSLQEEAERKTKLTDDLIGRINAFFSFRRQM